MRKSDVEPSKWFAAEKALIRATPSHGCCLIYFALCEFNNNYDILRDMLQVWKR